MLSAQAFVETDRAGRYLVQVCRHFSNKGRHLSGSAARPGGAAGTTHPAAGARHSAASPGQPDAVAGQVPSAGDVGVEWSATEGLITFGWGRASLQATATALVLRAEADSAESLHGLTELLAGHLRRFGRRDHLTVTWQPAEVPGTADTARP
jgi:hypothetical protein